jgi:hypothetical protein
MITNGWNQKENTNRRLGYFMMVKEMNLKFFKAKEN